MPLAWINRPNSTLNRQNPTRTTLTGVQPVRDTWDSLWQYERLRDLTVLLVLKRLQARDRLLEMRQSYLVIVLINLALPKHDPFLTVHLQRLVQPINVLLIPRSHALNSLISSNRIRDSPCRGNLRGPEPVRLRDRL